jgi:hypothetical protein
LFYLFATRAVRRKFGLNVWVERFVTNPPELRKQKFQEKNYAKNKSMGSPKIDDIPHSRVSGRKGEDEYQAKNETVASGWPLQPRSLAAQRNKPKKETGVVPGLSVLSVC